jgi:hypothetical protein
MNSSALEPIALFGRRRVGKTFLISQYLSKSQVFEFVGTRDTNLATQLVSFPETQKSKYLALQGR